jgi:hypothetical protein
MTKLKTDWYPDPIPGFDAIEWKRKVQAEVYEETKDMTREQVREYYRQVVERDKRWRAETADR